MERISCANINESTIRLETVVSAIQKSLANIEKNQEKHTESLEIHKNSIKDEINGLKIDIERQKNTNMIIAWSISVFLIPLIISVLPVIFNYHLNKNNNDDKSTSFVEKSDTVIAKEREANPLRILGLNLGFTTSQ